VFSPGATSQALVSAAEGAVAVAAGLDRGVAAAQDEDREGAGYEKDECCCDDDQPASHERASWLITGSQESPRIL
jgi:hypothetical protein